MVYYELMFVLGTKIEKRKDGGVDLWKTKRIFPTKLII